MRETQQRSDATAIQAVSNALVRLHKEQFGRGPTNARSNFAGPDTLVCVMEDALLPAERTMVEMGEQQRIRESRTFLQVATQDEFVKTVEAIISRKVRAFASAIDPDPGVVSRSSASFRKRRAETARSRPELRGSRRRRPRHPRVLICPRGRSARVSVTPVGGWPCVGSLRR